MAEHKTKSPKTGQGTSQGGDQQQRAGGRGTAGGSHQDDTSDRGGAGEHRGKGGSRGGSE